MTPAQLAAFAQSVGGTIVQTPAAAIIIVPLAAAAPRGDEYLSLEEARALAKLRTTRPLRDAARAGELALGGKKFSRVVKRADLLAWLEARRAPVLAGVDDADIERRMARLSKKRPSRRAATAA